MFSRKIIKLTANAAVCGAVPTLALHAQQGIVENNIISNVTSKNMFSFLWKSKTLYVALALVIFIASTYVLVLLDKKKHLKKLKNEVKELKSGKNLNEDKIPEYLSNFLAGKEIDLEKLDLPQIQNLIDDEKKLLKESILKSVDSFFYEKLSKNELFRCLIRFVSVKKQKQEKEKKFEEMKDKYYEGHGNNVIAPTFKENFGKQKVKLFDDFVNKHMGTVGKERLLGLSENKKIAAVDFFVKYKEVDLNLKKNFFDLFSSLDSCYFDEKEFDGKYLEKLKSLITLLSKEDFTEDNEMVSIENEVIELSKRSNENMGLVKIELSKVESKSDLRKMCEDYTNNIKEGLKFLGDDNFTEELLRKIKGFDSYKKTTDVIKAVNEIKKNSADSYVNVNVSDENFEVLSKAGYTANDYLNSKMYRKYEVYDNEIKNKEECIKLLIKMKNKKEMLDNKDKELQDLNKNFWKFDTYPGKYSLFS